MTTEEFRVSVARLHSLLQEPQEGLFTWRAMVDSLLGALAEHHVKEARRTALEEAAKVAEAFLHHEKTAEEDERAAYSNGTVKRCAAAIRALGAK